MSAVTFGSTDIDGHLCNVQQIGKSPNPDAWIVYFFDKGFRIFVNVCPEPQESEEGAIEMAKTILADAGRYARCVVAMSNEYFQERYNGLPAQVDQLDSNIRHLRRRIARVDGGSEEFDA